jgi:hypothetical protein
MKSYPTTGVLWFVFMAFLIRWRCTCLMLTCMFEADLTHVFMNCPACLKLTCMLQADLYVKVDLFWNGFDLTLTGSDLLCSDVLIKKTQVSIFLYIFIKWWRKFKNSQKESSNSKVCVMLHICDRLWENPAKVARQNSEKKGTNIFFIVKMPFSREVP